MPDRAERQATANILMIDDLFPIVVVGSIFFRQQVAITGLLPAHHATTFL